MRSRRLRARRRKRDGMDELGSPIRYAATRSAGRTITARGRDDSVKSEIPNKLHPVGALLLLMILTAFFPRASWCQKNAVVAGEFFTDPPTLVSLGFEWRISGDGNRNARVDATFRKRGEQGWRKALPLLRLQGEQVLGGIPREGGAHYFSYVAPNMFAGSILDLEPGTEYECRFILSDPDGVKGKAERMVTLRTRKEPEPAAGGHVYNVYPFGLQRRQAGACLHRLARRILHGRRRIRPFECDAAARAARRYHFGPRRNLQGQSLRL